MVESAARHARNLAALLTALAKRIHRDQPNAVRSLYVAFEDLPGPRRLELMQRACDEAGIPWDEIDEFLKRHRVLLS
jgi:hypothetical protein